MSAYNPTKAELIAEIEALKAKLPTPAVPVPAAEKGHELGSALHQYGAATGRCVKKSAAGTGAFMKGFFAGLTGK
jgi:hypothetical protein